MDAKEYMREKTRMFDSLRYGLIRGVSNCQSVPCSQCPLMRESGCANHTEEGVDIVEKWSKEHPIKTILTDFLEKYPNATLKEDGIPRFCPHHLGYGKDGEAHCRNLSCVDCWNRPLYEVETK